MNEPISDARKPGVSAKTPGPIANRWLYDLVRHCVVCISYAIKHLRAEDNNDANKDPT